MATITPYLIARNGVRGPLTSTSRRSVRSSTSVWSRRQRPGRPQ